MYPLTGPIYIKIQGSLIQKYHDEIIVEVFKRKHLKAYGKEYWSLSALSGYDRIIREDQQDYLFVKREISCDKPSACKKRREIKPSHIFKLV